VGELSSHVGARARPLSQQPPSAPQWPPSRSPPAPRRAASPGAHAARRAAPPTRALTRRRRRRRVNSLEARGRSSPLLLLPPRHLRSAAPAAPVRRAAAPARRALSTLARVAPPKGVVEPQQTPVVPPPAFGFVNNAEVLNSRACMIGFFALLAIEAATGKGLLELMGVTVGKGLELAF
jgi:hypothetical protein